MLLKKNNISVLDFMKKMGNRLVSFHFGAVYSHDIAMRELVDGFKPVYGASKLGKKRFGSSFRNDVMVCFTGCGWHCYWSNERLARVASSSGFGAVMKNLELRHPFDVNREGTAYVRGADGDNFRTGRRDIL
ncbi:hypothetical protein GUITHDRAFT_108776 [Guillardia theta CCMP2712]|uniref:Uncharacterized protein n=1 Tax=Guillardia theta (strain CCMP2712) TaxID=905079 RepID=L1JBP8_GUITC|nr:hypothetical protein GUITHDRAFT_108776 [Guillardia theta CCMP2712]EKX45515.1 hypothetical protein GUITHDRAFT_108776 [Guillardia theta CCMP2712]|eukprot:XP_005832495.1 hypothetical protein GUITHDRAFT_108776 [Guillardia theta CCMP2712]